MSDLTFNQLQYEVAAWSAKNFPDNEPYFTLLGLMEELGELSHAHLKMDQGIRGSTENLRNEARDAIGDLLIYLADYCGASGYDMQSIIEEVWSRVKKRDWKANPMDADVVAEGPSE